MPLIQSNIAAPTGTLAGTQNVLGGRAGEIVSSALHTQFYEASLAGKVFQATTLVAGVTLPVQGPSFTGVFTIWNPLGSSVNVELIRISHAFTTVTEVVGPIALYIQTGVGGANAVPTSLTALSTRPALWGGTGINPIASSVATVYSAATFTNTVGTNMFQGPILFGPAAALSTANLPCTYDFNGNTLLGPGVLATVACFAAQTQTSSLSCIWAEWPV